jgi:hypothetical protein
MQYARVLLMSTTAFCGPTMCPGCERAGCPSGVITDRPRCTPWCESSWCDAARCSSPPEDRGNPSCHLGGWSIRLIMGQQGPDHPGIVVGSGHRGHVGACAVCERAPPPPLRIGPPRGPLHDGARPLNQHVRTDRLPRFDIPPHRSLPPLEYCRGTSPNQAAKCRPLRNA